MAASANVSVVVSVSVNGKPDEQTMASYGIDSPRTRTRSRTYLRTNTEMNSAELTYNCFCVIIFCNSDRHTVWKFSGLRIQGVYRFSKTFENKTFARPRARPDLVRVGPRTRRLFRRPVRRTLRFGPFLQREHKKHQPCRSEEAPPKVSILRRRETPF